MPTITMTHEKLMRLYHEAKRTNNVDKWVAIASEFIARQDAAVRDLRQALRDGLTRVGDAERMALVRLQADAELRKLRLDCERAHGVIRKLGARVLTLRAALTAAAKVIEVWHNMPGGAAADVWPIYWRSAPEMKPIREALEEPPRCPHGATDDEVCPECLGVPSDNPDDEAREAMASLEAKP